MAPASAGVVVGFDGSPGSEAALRVALREAKARQARLLVVAAWHVPSHYYGSAATQAARAALADELRSALAARLEEAVATLREEAADVEIETRLLEGTAAGALTKEAASADLLVVGSRGLGGLRELLLGSVSHQCAQHAPCPVLIVPAQRPTPSVPARATVQP
jgi:nucleotide-binding universal stress UspA family protein